MADTLKIRLRSIEENAPVDVQKLRPPGSYKKLIETRSHPVDRLIEKHGRIPVELLRPRNCPTCGSADSAPEMSKDHLEIVRCRSCDLIFVSPIFSDDHYREIYNSEEYSEVVAELNFSSHEYRRDRFGRERVGIMSRYLDKASRKPRFLDIGCNTGFVVEAAMQAGWDAMGMELNQAAVNFGRSRGLDLQVGDVLAADLPADSFDAIGLFDVIEHVPDPAALIERARGLLKPNGLLFLYVPNWDSASRLLLKDRAHFIWPTHHLTYYTPKTLHTFLSTRGFDSLYLETEGLDIADYVWMKEEVDGADMTAVTDIASEIQFFANAAGWGKNLRCLARKVG